MWRPPTRLTPDHVFSPALDVWFSGSPTLTPPLSCVSFPLFNTPDLPNFFLLGSAWLFVPTFESHPFRDCSNQMFLSSHSGRGYFSLRLHMSFHIVLRYFYASLRPPPGPLPWNLFFFPILRDLSPFWIIPTVWTPSERSSFSFVRPGIFLQRELHTPFPRRKSTLEVPLRQNTFSGSLHSIITVRPAYGTSQSSVCVYRRCYQQ